MKLRFDTRTLAVLLVISRMLSPAQEKITGLLAEPYPGSKTDPNRPLAGAPSRSVLEARSREYYSKDPAEKVKTFYKSIGEFYISPEGDHIQVCDVIPFNKVAPIVEKKGGVIGEGGDNFWGGTRAGVTLYGKPVNTNYTVTKVFGSLDQAYLQRFVDPNNPDMASTGKHLEDPELKKAKAKYEHLQWAYYMQSDSRRKDNLPGTLSMDEVIYDKHYTAPAEARAKELADVQKKYGEAMAAMQYDVATKLGEKMMALSGIQPDHKADWDTAIKCLEEMQVHAYQTKIVIDMHPSGWDLTPPKN